MSKNTVKPGSRRKRTKREVENAAFDTFTQRIVRAYARRVANGDVESLRSLAGLSCDVDAATRDAVRGLRRSPYSYSWQEIADRLGVSRQAAQMRYGDRTERGALDRRLLDAGNAVTVAVLAAVFADHHPGIPAPSLCPACGFRYTNNATECPTLATVRPILHRRRHEDQRAIERLSPEQFEYLHGRRTARAPGAVVRRPIQTDDPSEQRHPSLFPINASRAGDRR